MKKPSWKFTASFLLLFLLGCGSQQPEGPLSGGDSQNENPQPPETPLPPKPKLPPFLDLPLTSNPGSDPEEPDMPDPVASDPFVDEIVSFHPGENSGSGQDQMPAIVLGPPRGSMDVLSLGQGGSIVLKSDTPILNGTGADFIVFENPFDIQNQEDYSPFAELAEVAVSQDGVHFQAFPCQYDNEAALYPGCAGVHLVLAPALNSEVLPEPEAAGGDAFDLQTLGLAWVQYLRIRDLKTPDWGDDVNEGTKAGFDLDAVGIRHQ